MLKELRDFSVSFPRDFSVSFPRKRESIAFIKSWIPYQVGDDSKFFIPFLSCQHSSLSCPTLTPQRKRPLRQKDAFGVTEGRVPLVVTEKLSFPNVSIGNPLL